MIPTKAITTITTNRMVQNSGVRFQRIAVRGGLTFLVLAAMVAGGVMCLSQSNNSVRALEAEYGKTLSRRTCLSQVGVGLGIFCAGAGGKPSLAAESIKIESESPSEQLEIYRKGLMNLIQQPSNNEAEILSAIEKLVPFDPSKRKGASLAEELDGEWELLWSAKAEAFSPLLKLPKPLKPDSFQYLGSAAAGEVGPDRVAQGLTGGILGQTQLWLSSGVRPSSTDDSILEILPPFRFEVGGRYQTGTPKKRLVEAGSDAEFRKLNARTNEAQAAPKNSYQQLYLERQGIGSLRISTITDGDPVIVGAIFVHQKL